MTPQLSQVSEWMTSQHRTIRFAPITKVSTMERCDTAQFIVRAMRDFCKTTKCHVGFGPEYITGAVEAEVDPVEVFHALTLLHAQVFAAYHTYGMPAAVDVGLYELTKTDGTKDFKKALEIFYPTK